MTEKTITVNVPDNKKKIEELEEMLQTQKDLLTQRETENAQNIASIQQDYNVYYDTDLFSSVTTVAGMQKIAQDLDKQKALGQGKKIVPAGKATIKKHSDYDSLRETDWESADVFYGTLQGILDIGKSHPSYKEARELWDEITSKECHSIKGFSPPTGIMEFDEVPEGLKNDFSYSEYNKWIQRKFGKDGEHKVYANKEK